MAGDIGLGELIDTVAEELLEAERRAAGRSKRILQLDGVELTLTVTVEKEGKGGIRIYVVSLGGGKKSSNTHTIKTTFKPAGEGALFQTSRPPRGSRGPKFEK